MDISVDYFSWNSEIIEELFRKAIQLNNKALLYSEEALRVMSQILFILKVRKGYDLYHIVSPALTFIVIVRRPAIITIHDLIPYVKPRSVTDILIRKSMSLVRRANRIICVSESTKKDLLRFIDVDPKKVRVIYEGVDHDLFKPRDRLEARRKLGLPLDRPLILNVGSEEPRKNIPVLLRSFKKLLDDVPNALLARVGERTAQIEKLIEKLELSKRIMYLRPSDKELAYLYDASDVFVYPSYYEGLGLPLLEAMASGLPVIAGNKSAVPEVVGNAGILLDPFDVNGFAYWMREVLANEDLRVRLSEKGYKRSLSFSWEKCARETLEVYKEVLDEV
jgi:glycosyltransferase involved in cell wall biosynthesis